MEGLTSVVYAAALTTFPPIFQVGVDLSEAATDRCWCWLHDIVGIHRQIVERYM